MFLIHAYVVGENKRLGDRRAKACFHCFSGIVLAIVLERACKPYFADRFWTHLHGAISWHRKTANIHRNGEGL